MPTGDISALIQMCGKRWLRSSVGQVLHPGGWGLSEGTQEGKNNAKAWCTGLTAPPASEDSGSTQDGGWDQGWRDPTAHRSAHLTVAVY